MLQILRDSIHVTRPQSIGSAEEVGRKEGISGRQEGNSNELHDLLIRQRRRWITSYCDWRSKDTNRDKLLFVCVGGPNLF